MAVETSTSSCKAFSSSVRSCIQLHPHVHADAGSDHFTNDKLFKLVDMDHREMERSIAAAKEGEASSAVISSLHGGSFRDILTLREGAPVTFG